MSKTVKGTYRGPVSVLHGKTALIQDHPDPTKVRVQWDDKSLWEKIMERRGESWPTYDRKDFDIEETE